MPTLSQKVRSIVADKFGATAFEETLEKAIRQAQENAASPQSMFSDPLNLFSGTEWISRHRTGMGQLHLSFSELRVMAKNPVIGSIIQTRINQMATFMEPQRDFYSPGFKVVRKDHQEPDLEEVIRISAWLMTTGLEGYGEPDLETLARKWCRDTLVLDQTAIEVVPNRDGTPSYLVAVDAATIRLLRRAIEHAVPPGDDETLYVQILNEKIVTEYNARELIFGVRNWSTDIHSAGYGFSELEMLVRIVTTMMNTERYNAGQVTQGGTQKGLLVVKGTADQEQFSSFKRDFREAIRNAAAFWRPPVLQIAKDADVDWVRLDSPNRDMEYSQLFDFLVKQACGVYQIDPSEINWVIGASGASTTFEARQKDQILLSQKKGLSPLLKTFANQLNRCIVNFLNPEYMIEFVGVGVDREIDGDIREKEVKSYITVNEQRAEIGLKPIIGGDVILNENFVESSPRLRVQKAAIDAKFSDPENMPDVNIEQELGEVGEE